MTAGVASRDNLKTHRDEQGITPLSAAMEPRLTSEIDMKPRTPSFFRPAVALAVLSLSAGVAMADTPAPHSSPRANDHGYCSARHRADVEAVIQEYVDVCNSHDVSRYPEIFADDYRLVSTAGATDGLAAFTGLMSAVYTAMPDLHYEIDEILVDGDNAVLRYHYTGTSTGSFMGLPPSGNTVSCTGLEIDRIEDGKLIESRNFTDYHCLLAGLGAL